MSAGPLTSPPSAEVAFHDAECGGYRADLSVWDELCAEVAEPVELGAGTGRVSLHLAAADRRPLAVDRSAPLLDALSARARERGLEVGTRCADARELDLGHRAEAILAPMQFVLLMGGPSGRARLLAAAARSLQPGGLLALTLLDESEPALRAGRLEVLPDVREVDGWVHSSLPVAIEVGAAAVEVVRLRQVVSPAGDLREQRNVVRLDRLSPETLLGEGRTAGFLGGEVRYLPPTADHVGSVLVTMQRQ